MSPLPTERVERVVPDGLLERPIIHTNEFDKQPLPVGGQRVPQGMEAHADWHLMPEVASCAPVDSSAYGAEYVRLETRRSALTQLKKAVSALMILVASIKTNAAIGAKAPADSDKKQQTDKLNEKSLKDKEAALQDIANLREKVKDDQQLTSVLDRIQAECDNEYTPEEWQTFQEVVKLNTSSWFREQNSLLQQMKAEKKKAAAK